MNFLTLYCKHSYFHQPYLYEINYHKKCELQIINCISWTCLWCEIHPFLFLIGELKSPLKIICPDMNCTHNKSKQISFPRAIFWRTAIYLWLKGNNLKCKQTNIKLHKRRAESETTSLIIGILPKVLKLQQIRALLWFWQIFLSLCWGHFGSKGFGGFFFYSFDSFDWKAALKIYAPSFYLKTWEPETCFLHMKTSDFHIKYDDPKSWELRGEVIRIMKANTE